MVKLTNFQQIAPSHVQPLFCPVLYIPCPASGSEGLDSQRQCGSISCNASLYRWGGWGGGERRKKSLVFSFLFQVCSERFPDTDSRSSDSRRNTGFHCAAIREGEKERERERERASTGSQGITDVPLSLSLFPLTILACRSPRSIRCITKPFQSSCQQNTNLQKQKCFENLNPAT